jgi:phytoene dehydrogenase-like protein
MKIFLAVKFALLPFVVFWALLGAGHPDWAVWFGFAFSFIGNSSRIWHREWMVLEAGGFLLFASLTAAELMSPTWTAASALWVSFAGLGFISLASALLGRPWTADYARAAYPHNATSPQFHMINAAITLFWGMLFLAIGLCRWAGLSEWVTGPIVAAGALVSIFGPRLAIAFALKRLRASRESFHWPAPAFAKDEDRDCDVAIVGAGIGGLTTAALLADSGLKVKVFDHHLLAGGFCHTYVRKTHYDNNRVTYRFDAGPHDFSGVWPGGAVTSVLERLVVAERMQWKRVAHSYHAAGRRIDVPEDWRDYVKLLCEQFPDSAKGIRRLFETINAIFEDMFSTGRGRTGIPGMPETVNAMLAFPKEHPAAYKWMNEPFDKLVASYVSDPDLIRLLNALSGYLGDGGERLTCAQMVPIYGYYFKGGFYPLGGSGRFSDVLVEAIEERGGEVHLKSKVGRILVEDGRAAGIALEDGRVVRACAVVSNADIKRTFLELVEAQHLPPAFRDRIAAAEPANSAFSVHLGLDFVPDIRPATHVSAPMGVGLANMSQLDGTAAPPGHSTLMLISIMPYAVARNWFPSKGGEDWSQWRHSDEYEARKQELGDRMITAAETVIPDLRQHIVYRADASPVTYARYDWTSYGAIYGISKQGRLNGSKSPIRNLVIAGSGNAGAGVEAVLISGAEAAEALRPGLLSRKLKSVTQARQPAKTGRLAEEATV